MSGKNKLPIKLQSVTMSAEQYEEICDKIEKVNSLEKNIMHLFHLMREKGVDVRAKDDKIIYDEIHSVDVSFLGGINTPLDSKKVIIFLK